MAAFALLWVAYALALVLIAKYSQSHDALLPGKVGVAVQALAYVATYISAVALVGFGGLCYMFGMQMILIAAGNVWFGTWFVYKYLAWPSRLWQRKLNARTPAELLSKAYGSPMLQTFLGVISTVLLVVYGSAVFKGAAVMVAGVLPVSVNAALIALVVIVGVSVIWGGLRGVLYTEALQGLVMFVGIGALLIALVHAVGGPLTGMKALAALPPTKGANNGFMALSSGPSGLNIIFLTIVTSVGIWAKPQLIQRHFALRSAEDTKKAAPYAMFALSVVVGGAYFLCALSRLILGPSITNPDTVMPTLVTRLLPAFGQQLFALAIVSASLSTASAVLHIASGSLVKDVLEKGSHGLVLARHSDPMRVLQRSLRTRSSSIIAIICSTSWTLLACAIIVPYLALLIQGPKAGARAALSSSLLGFAGSIGWYFFAYASTSKGISGMAAPGLLGAMHPIVIGTLVSLVVFFALAERAPVVQTSRAAQ